VCVRSFDSKMMREADELLRVDYQTDAQKEGVC